MDQLDILKRLQRLDAGLFRCRRAQREKPLALEAARGAVNAQAAKVTAAEDQLKTLQLAQKQKEVDLQEREEKVRKLQGQLFQLKTNKEYTAMQREIQGLKADNSLLEEAIIKLFDAVDQAASVRQREQAALAQAQEQFQAEEARIHRELAEITEQMACLERERQGMLPDVPPPTLTVYEQVLHLREGVALAPLVKESCGGCHRRLPPQVINEVYLKAKLVTCENCNRILYQDAS